MKCPSEYQILQYLDLQTEFVFSDKIENRFHANEELTISVVNWLIDENYISKKMQQKCDNLSEPQYRITPAGREKLRQLKHDKVVDKVLLLEAIIALSGLFVSIVTLIIS